MKEQLFFRVSQDEYQLPIGVCNYCHIEMVHDIPRELFVRNARDKKSTGFQKVDIDDTDD